MVTRESIPVSNDPPTYSSGEAVRQYAERAMGGQLFVPERKLLDRHFQRSNARVLDVGCGVGRTTHRLASRGFDVTGMDVSEEMIQQGRTLFPDLDFQVGDAADLPFESGMFDYVLFSYFGLDLVSPESRRKTALAELRRVLDGDGLLAFSSRNEWYALPALFTDRTYLLDFYAKDGNLYNLGESYKIDAGEYGAAYYFSNPIEQWRQLRALGFELIDVVGKRDGPLRYLERQPYYVARKRS